MNITGYECSMHTEDDMDKTWKTAYYCCLTAVFVVCNVIFVILYSILGRLLWKYKNGTLVPGMTLVSDKHKKESLESSLESSFESSQSRKIVNDQRKNRSARYIVVFFSVTVVFILSYLPHLVVRLILLLGIQLTSNFSRDSSELVYNIIVRSYLISNVANPFIYSILTMPRQIIFKCLRHCDKHFLITNQRQKLSDVPFFLIDDLTDQDLQTRRSLKDVIDNAVKEKKRWKFRNGKLVIEGQVYKQ